MKRLLPSPVRPCLAPSIALALSLAACGGGGGGGDEGPARVNELPQNVAGGGSPFADGSGTPSDPAATAPAVVVKPALTGDGGTSGCGEITVARMNWASAEIIAEIDRRILRDGFGCDVTLVPGDTIGTFEAMRVGEKPDLAPELWTRPVRDELAEAVALGNLVVAAPTLVDGGTEGWWIPRTVADANPGIRTVADALARPELFPSPDGGPLAALHTCPSGWNCRTTNENLFRAHGADAAGFALIDPGSAQGLDDSVARAVERGEGWLGYYWSPTALVGRYDMVRLESPSHDPAEWERCTTRPDCADPAPIAYPRSEIRAVFGAGFAERAGVALEYIERRRWGNVTVNAVLAWREDNEATGEEAAVHFLENYEAVWLPWVDAATATRVRSAL